MGRLGSRRRDGQNRGSIAIPGDVREVLHPGRGRFRGPIRCRQPGTFSRAGRRRVLQRGHTSHRSGRSCRSRSDRSPTQLIERRSPRPRPRGSKPGIESISGRRSPGRVSPTVEPGDLPQHQRVEDAHVGAEHVAEHGKQHAHRRERRMEGGRHHPDVTRAASIAEIGCRSLARRPRPRRRRQTAARRSLKTAAPRIVTTGRRAAAQASGLGGAPEIMRKRSSGNGNTTVVFFSTPISVSVCR